MATSTRYATTAEFKQWLGIADSVDDALLATVLDQASRDIDNYCGRVFNQSTAATARYYTARRSDELLIADCVSLSAVATDADGDRTYEDTWTATDYDLLPENAAADSEPYTTIAVAPGGDYSFPVGVRKGVKLTGVWGWPAVPGAVSRLVYCARPGFQSARHAARLGWQRRHRHGTRVVGPGLREDAGNLSAGGGDLMDNHH